MEELFGRPQDNHPVPFYLFLSPYLFVIVFHGIHRERYTVFDLRFQMFLLISFRVNSPQLAVNNLFNLEKLLIPRSLLRGSS
jgi:hypothetical protein